jgi:hypothetical protein
MSSSGVPPVPQGPDRGPTPSNSARSGCLSAFLVLLGIVLLLPGLCPIAFVLFDWRMALDSSVLPIMLLCLGSVFGGIMMIRAGIKGPRG